MDKYKQRPSPATHPDHTHSAKIYAEIKRGHKVEPRYVEIVLQAITAKFEIAEKMQSDFMKKEATEELAVVTAYQNRGTQSEVLIKAGDQKRLAEAFGAAGQVELQNKALKKSEELVNAWMAYQVDAKF